MAALEEQTTLDGFVPPEVFPIEDAQTALPAIAKNAQLLEAIHNSVQRVPTRHELHHLDARDMQLPPESVHLVLTSPPYWTLKEYRDSPGKMGHIAGYDEFLAELDRV